MNPVESTPPSLLTRREAARFLSVSERQVWNLQNDGRLPHVRIGRSVRFRVTDLEAFVASRTVKAR
ncbi:excisionase family DNA-binding domain-containing protein [Haloferula helveola]|uniref:Excisionase family DNA-binding domain-containing protein n=1 Tax=Haloferula helveola TaxID=490095 RepID=A0ABM7RA08_9BACT|nr:excisionase family DNA-binding domain-containing protein [Haloferula helveola]